MSPRRGPILIALDSFKGSIGARSAVKAVALGWRRADPTADVRCLPMADGGEGTLEAFASAIPGAVKQPVTVTGPDGAATQAAWLRLPASADCLGGTGVVELAAVCGIERFSVLQPLDASTYGLGQVIVAALQAGVSRLVIAIGGSASTDGGLGLLTALGAKFTDRHGHPVPLGGRGLEAVASVDLTGLPPLPVGGAEVLVDVSNPLVGPDGAAAVFGPQKGADPDQVERLDAGLRHLATFLSPDPMTPGAGAAGGTGYGLLAWGAQPVKGSSTVARMVGLPELLTQAELVITGEGSYDRQSQAGKAPEEVRRLAAETGTPVALIAGRIDPTVDASAFCSAISLTELAGSTELALAEPAQWLEAAGGLLAQQWRAPKR